MILVTGAAGFIGHHLIEGLRKENLDYATLDLKDTRDLHEDSGEKVFLTDITSESQMEEAAKALEKLDITSCVHLAALASPRIAQAKPKESWLTNVQGTHNVLQLLHRINCKRIIFFASAHVYGISPKYMPTDENHPLALHDTYTTTKIMGEDLCRLFYENHGISYTNLRLWNAYGPGQSPDYFIGAKINQAKTQKKLTIWNGKITKDWIHISDVIKATIAAIDTQYVGPLNVGTGIETTLETIIQIISENFSIPIEPEDLPDDGPTRMRCDWRRIKQTLGWEPTIDFKDGLRDLIEKSKAAP